MKSFILVALSLMTYVSAKADDPQIQVQGSCQIKVTPDRGTLIFTAENQSKDQKEAVKRTTEQVEKLKAQIKKLNLKDLELKNSNYNVYPVREYEKERYVDKGYKAALNLEVTTSEISRIGETMMKASEVGIINVGNLTTFLSLEKSREEYLKCLDIAADDAREKAKQLAKRLGFKIGEVILLNEVPNIPGPFPEHRLGAMKTMMDSAPVQIEAGTQNYSTNIQVTFKIK